jgi:uncharacterized coiled-coil protein SlyX
MRIAACVIVAALLSPLSALHLSHDVAAQDAEVTETSLLPSSADEVSDRESRLRNIEDELLKQLSLGGTPRPQETTESALPNLKRVNAHIDAEEHSSEQPVAAGETANPKASKPTIGAVAEREPSPSEEVRRPTGRSPEASIVVPVAATSVPYRTPRVAKRAASEALSAKDLEHRLAIAESQITLLTQELERTKAKLANSESQVEGLTRQIEDGDTKVTSTTSQSSHPLQPGVKESGAASSDSVTTRAATYETRARVTKDHAPLKVGPGSQESTITKLSRNSLISVEHRTGGWYRIITSDGTRGWISGTFLMFDEGSSRNSTIRVGAYEPRFESMDIRY